MTTFLTIESRITEYHASKATMPYAKKSATWFDIFSSIRKAFYADQINWSEYETLMDQLDLD